ncbi:hypothetical protein LRP52_37075 [Photobacterium sp. ZSDE20]|uniref:Transcriptional regulator n=1 Tax=Photobacterium pectinilyticum TaxID=2906793 RepID=A0ABT1N778_9GAMM|nr:hypothetical protein [Photobacterium sp. ZSDE20]MCQ1060605.1 hypothetical protein [Photobacterium sp. ZSDE20]MDD1827800.1 hypothetical protein [Photobacterium sp. ZSDE20]
MEQSTTEFYEDLSREMDELFTTILEKNIQPLLDNEINASQWCRDIAFEHHISEGFSAAYLKEKHGMEVKLLPEPELFITIECEACLGSSNGICHECLELSDELNSLQTER